MELPLEGSFPVPGAGWLVGGAVLPAMSLPGVVREGQRAFWLGHFAWHGAGRWPGVKGRALCPFGFPRFGGFGAAGRSPAKAVGVWGWRNCPPGQWLACCVRFGGFAPALAGVFPVVHRQAAGGRASGWVVVGVLGCQHSNADDPANRHPALHASRMPFLLLSPGGRYHCPVPAPGQWV